MVYTDYLNFEIICIQLGEKEERNNENLYFLFFFLNLKWKMEH
jgi:hypothetical protein